MGEFAVSALANTSKDGTQSSFRASVAAYAGTRGWFVVLVILCAGAAMIWRTTVTYPTEIFDFYPLYYGAKAWLQTGNAYVLEPVAPIAHHQWDVYKVGNAYPLPAVLLILPLSFLSPSVAAVIWVGLLVVGMLLALRLSGMSVAWAFSLPIIDGIRIEQYSILIVIGQILAIWAWRTRRPWLLAVCCTVALTKPSQSLFFVLVIAFLARNWFQQGVMIGLLWGGSLLVDPTWIGEWLPTLNTYRLLTDQPFLWGLAFFAIPFLLMRDWLAAANLLQFLVLPFPVNSTYALGAVPLTLLGERRSYWLALCSYLWVLLIPTVGRPWAMVFATLVPATVFAALHHYGWPKRLRYVAPAGVTSAGD